MPREAYIIDAVRTPGGKRNGKLKDWHPAALAAHDPGGTDVFALSDKEMRKWRRRLN